MKVKISDYPGRLIARFHMDLVQMNKNTKKQLFFLGVYAAMVTVLVISSAIALFWKYL